jgi:hypothetical protein
MEYLASLLALTTTIETAKGVHVGVHAFRHGITSELLESGTPIHVVTRLMRHADSNVTLEHYAHIVGDAERIASPRSSLSGSGRTSLNWSQTLNWSQLQQLRPRKERTWRKRVGVENNAERNLKDLEDMLGSAKSLKRNNRECKGILIGPSMAPRFFGA